MYDFKDPLDKLLIKNPHILVNNNNNINIKNINYY